MSSAARHPLFEPLDQPPMQEGTQVLTYVASTGWRAYGARTWTDWSYALSVAIGVRDVAAEWSSQVAAQASVQALESK